MNNGALDEYASLFREAFALAEQSGDPALHIAVAPSVHSLYVTGALDEGIAKLDRALDLADGDPTVGAGTTLGSPYAFGLTLKGLLVGTMGELERGRRVIEQGSEIARDQGDIEVLGWNHMFTGWLAHFEGDYETTLAQARPQMDCARRIGDAFSLSWAWLVTGFAERLHGNWTAAIDALERSHAIARERRTAVEGDAWRLSELAEAYLGLGDTERAHDLVRQRFALPHPHSRGPFEIHASLSVVRVLLRSDSPAARARAQAELARVRKLADETNARSFGPLIHAELAELSHRCGDEKTRERAMRRAHRLSIEIGARTHADRLEAQLATLAG